MYVHRKRNVAVDEGKPPKEYLGEEMENYWQSIYFYVFIELLERLNAF